MNNSISQIESVENDYFSFFKQQSKIHFSEIILLEAHINYTQLYLRNGQKVMVSKTMKVFEDILSNHNFYRIHRAFMINGKHLKSYDSTLKEVILTNDYKAVTSRRRRGNFEGFIFGSVQ
jgi:two-component system, LytTR family, response regulator